MFSETVYLYLPLANHPLYIDRQYISLEQGAELFLRLTVAILGWSNFACSTVVLQGPSKQPNISFSG